MTDIITTEPQTLDTSVVEQLTRSEVEMQVATANRYPRSIDTFKKKALTLATANAEIAQECFYVLPRGGKNIEGPSIRLAEIVAGAYKNLRCEARVVAEGERTITAQATVWDMESNVLIRCETSRRITGKDGRRYNDDMIVMTGNAAASIALRNAVFKVVPFAYVKPIYKQCQRVALGGKGTDQAKTEWFDMYATRYGVDNKRVLAMLGKSHIDDVGLGDITTLQGIFTALQEGSVTADTAFPAAKPKEGTFGFKDKEKKTLTANKKAAEAPEEAPQAAAEKTLPPSTDNDEKPWDKHRKT